MAMGKKKQVRGSISLCTSTQLHYRGCTHTDRETGRGNMPCEAPFHAVSMPRHARHGHAPRHTNRSSKEKEKIEARGGRCDPFIHFTHNTYQARVREGVYDVTSASLCFLKSRPVPLSAVKDSFRSRTVRRCFDGTPSQRSWDWSQSGNNISYLLHPFSHEGFTSTQRSATQASLTLSAADRSDFWGGRSQERAAQREVR
ncbi:hypothetical protein F5888DRAFT_584768 [Russula emetica]|nr:hypothetical protein F5888DRAFT_584768 [Russula emetica]